MLCYDVESTFLRKGFKRKHTKLLEIAFYNKSISFQRMINPCAHYHSGEEIIEDLYTTGSDPDKTLRFWTKLLIEKGSLSSTNRRKNKFEQADAISALLRRSDIAMKHKQPLHVLYFLENGYTEKESIEQVKLKTTIPKPNGFLFYPASSVLKYAINTFSKYTWVAHNGKSFDEQILKGMPLQWEKIQFTDSIPVFKALCPHQDSYSQPILYQALLQKKYRAHHALDDSKALYQLLTHVLKDRDINSVKAPEKPRATQSDLVELQGVGPVTAGYFAAKNIKNKQELYAYVRNHSFEQFSKSFKFRGSRKLAEFLYNIR